MERERESPVRLPDVGGRRVGLELEELVEVGLYPDVFDDVVDLQLLLLEGRRHADAAEEDEEAQSLEMCDGFHILAQEFTEQGVLSVARF